MGLVAQRLKQKKYPTNIIKHAKDRAFNLDRDKCLRGKSKKDKNFQLSFVTKYSNNARQN